jgi:hypothetical protein
MARGTKAWLEQLLNILAVDNDPDDDYPGKHWDKESYRSQWSDRLKQLNTGTAGQDATLRALTETDRRRLLDGILQIAQFSVPQDDIYSQKMHDAVLNRYVDYVPEELPDLYKWSKQYGKSAHLRSGQQEQDRASLESLLKTKTGKIRNPIQSLYRFVRGNAYLNQSKDLIGIMSDRVWDPQITTALTKLAKHGHIRHDPKTGTILFPRDTIRQIDPYYEKYQETLGALSNVANNDYIELYKQMADDKFDERKSPYNDMINELARDQVRRNLQQIPEDAPIEERERILAEQQNELNQTLLPPDYRNTAQALANYNSGLAIESGKKLLVDSFGPRVKLASVFSEKGLRSLLNHPKRALRLAQINEMLDDNWNDIIAPGHEYLWHPGWQGRNAQDRHIDDAINAIPREDYSQIARIQEPSGPWKRGELNSLNNYDTLRRTLAENKRQVVRRGEEIRAQITQYIAAHPEIQDRIAANNEQRLLEDIRGIGYTPTAEDKEEQDLLSRVPSGNYQKKIANILKNPRLVQLAERPYHYSKDMLSAIPSDSPWRLAKNRRDLYDRSLNHSICVGVPQYSYHNNVQAKKSLIFFSGEHTDLESETGELALYIDPKTKKIKKVTIEQVHGVNNRSGSSEGIAALRAIAKQLPGKSVEDINNVVEQKGIEYKEQRPADEDLEELYNDYLNREGMAAGLPDHWQIGEHIQEDDNVLGEIFQAAAVRMQLAGYHQDDDGNWLRPGDPRYDDWDAEGNRIVQDEGEFDENDPGYSGGGFVEPLNNPAYMRLLELLLDGGVTKPSEHIRSLVTRRF